VSATSIPNPGARHPKGELVERKEGRLPLTVANTGGKKLQRRGGELGTPLRLLLEEKKKKGKKKKGKRRTADVVESLPRGKEEKNGGKGEKKEGP